MPMTGEHGQTSHALVLAAFDRLWTINPEDIASDWINAMAKRLLNEINRQLTSVETARYDNETSQPASGERLTNARTLASLRDTLEKMTRLTIRHQATIQDRKSRDYETARAEIERIVDGVIVARASRKNLPAPK